MSAESLLVLTLLAACAGLLASLWVLLSLRRQPDADRIARSLTELDQGLRRELATSARGVQDASSNALRTSQSEFRREVTDRLDKVGAVSNATLEKTTGAIGALQVSVLERLTQGQAATSDKLARDLGGLAERVVAGFDGFGLRLREEQEKLRDLVASKLDELRAGNEAKLEAMRAAVDEKLQSALEKQVGESFQRVAEQFAAVQQAIGQVQSVAGQVGDLKRLFSNVKSRGGWGEAQLGAMLADVLPPGAFARNMKMRDGSLEVVEFAVRVPGQGREDAWLPIDAKFPTADYDRLLLAAEAGEREEEDRARASLGRQILLEAARIADKYIVTPRTLEFAVLYLPTEGLFAEVARIPGLLESTHREHRVIVMGPSLLPALLQTIRIGHLTLALERNAVQIGETLGAVKAEWEKLGGALDTLSKRAESLVSGIADTQRRTRAVGRKLRTVAAIDYAAASRVLELEKAELELATELMDGEEIG